MKVLKSRGFAVSDGRLTEAEATAIERRGLDRNDAEFHVISGGRVLDECFLTYRYLSVVVQLDAADRVISVTVEERGEGV